MSRRIDLSSKHDNSNFHIDRDITPFLYEDEEIENNENYEDENQEDLNEIKKEEEKEKVKNTEKNLQNAAVGYATGNVVEMASSASNILNDVKDMNMKEKAELASKVYIDLKKKAIMIKMLPFIIAIILIVIVVILFASIIELESNKGLATGGYYAMRCPEVTVIFVDKANGYTETGSETYPLEEYIAGVIRGEVLSLHNIEIYKEFALLARTYLLTHDNNCTIEASDRKQVFRPPEDGTSYSDMVYQAVEETKGQVLLKDNELINVQYDAFCSIAVDNNYYTIKQNNQKLPRSWVDSQGGIAESWKQGNCAGNHGRGVSTWGSYYLVTQQDYKYDEVLKYYLGDDIQISRGGFIGSIEGLEIKNTTNAATLNESLSSALESHGSSIQELDGFIHDSVVSNGAGTRAGVVTAAVSLINFLYDGMGVKIPYYWGGKYQTIGANPSFGAYTSASSKGHTHVGLDCSGFVSWAIVNGGFNFGGSSTSSFDQYSYGDNCYMSESDCIGQPGDLLNSTDCGGGIGHVQLIVAVDEESGVYYIAESASGVTMNSVPIHGGSCKNMKVLHMDRFYNTSANSNY